MTSSSAVIMERFGPGDWENIIENMTAENEHWAVTYYDMEVWQRGFGAGNYGHVLAKDRRGTGNIVAHAHWCKYGKDDTGAIGLYYCLPGNRHRGLGTAVFNGALYALKDMKNIHINGGVSMFEKYRDRHGFLHISDKRMECLSVGPPITLDKVRQTAATGITYRETSDDDMDKITKYDRSISNGLPRVNLIKEWLRHPAGYGAAAFDNTTGSVKGICVARRALNDLILVGPLYADSDAIGAGLLAEVLEQFEEYQQTTIFVQGTGPNIEGIKRLLGALAVDGVPPKCEGYLIQQATNGLRNGDKLRNYAIVDYCMSPC